MAGMLAACIGVLGPSASHAQTPKSAARGSSKVPTEEQPDAQRTKDELRQLLEHYPPTLRKVLALDPTLLSNPRYLAPYPGLVSFLNDHPEIARNPSFFVGEPPEAPQDSRSRAIDMWREVFQNLGVFAGFSLAAGMLIWLIRTVVDYRRWIRLSKVQTDVHNKLLDRFTANDDLLSYIQSPAGSKFLESSPIKLDVAPRSIGAPLGRILWSLQGGLVLLSGGIGLHVVGERVRDEAAQPLHALGILAIALGIGFVFSAIISYVISHRLGLIDQAPAAPRTESPNV